MNKLIAKCIVRNDGRIDRDASRAKYGRELVEVFNKQLAAAEESFSAGQASFDTDLDDYVKSRGQWDAMAEAAINDQFDRLGAAQTGGTIIKSTLVSMITASLVTSGKIKAAEFGTAMNMISSYIDDNAGPKESGAIFSVVAGKGGGVRMWARNKVA